jgi:hypothetical protein
MGVRFRRSKERCSWDWSKIGGGSFTVPWKQLSVYGLGFWLQYKSHITYDEVHIHLLYKCLRYLALISSRALAHGLCAANRNLELRTSSEHVLESLFAGQHNKMKIAR